MPGMYFIGVDFPLRDGSASAGLAFLQFDGKAASLKEYTTLSSVEDISLWILDRCRFFGIVAVNVPYRSPRGEAPLRPAEKQMAERLAPYAPSKSSNKNAYLGHSLRLQELFQQLSEWEFEPDPFFQPRTIVRAWLEVSSQASQVALFQLKKFFTPPPGDNQQRLKKLHEFQKQILEKLPREDPPLLANASLLSLSVSGASTRGSAKGEALEKVLNAVLCAYTGLYYWWWGGSRCQVFGSESEGYIVAPTLPRPP